MNWISRTIFNGIALAAIVPMNSAFAQCSGYSVDVIAGPVCKIFDSFAAATAITPDGTMCGGYLECNQTGHVVIWSTANEIIAEIPPSFEPGYPGMPFDMNAAGQAVGQLFVPSLSPSAERAYLYSKGQTINLGALPGHNWAVALAINASGVVIGNSNNSAVGPLKAFVWQAGEMTALSLPFNYFSSAFDISDSGLICGWMATNPPSEPNGADHAFIFDLASGQTIDAGILLDGAIGSRATGVNNAGVICGWSDIPCGKHCTIRRSFIWNDGEVQDLGVLPGNISTHALAINDSQVIVGYCASGGSQGFVWRNGMILALDDLISAEAGMTVDTAVDINSAGQIVGRATISGVGDEVAVRLTPIPSPIGDSNCDGDIDTDDLLGVINNWAHESPKGSKALPPCDFDHDGTVELDDLMIVIDNWTA